TYFLAGSFNDRHGPRLTLMISVIAMSMGYALMSTISAPWQLYTFYGVIVATGLSFGYMPVASSVPRWFVKSRGTALGITVAGIGMGTLVLAPFAQFLIFKFDWRFAYLILAGLFFIIVFPVSRLMRLDPSEKGLLPYGIEETPVENKRSDSSPLSPVDFTVRQAMKTKPFWLLFVMYVLALIPIQMVMVHLKAYAVHFGVAEMTAAIALGLVGGVSIIGRIVMGSVSDKIGRKASFIIAFLLMALMMLWLLKARQPWQFYLFSAIFGFGYGGFVPLVPAIVGDWFGMKFHGSIFGILSLAVAIGGAIGPLLAGYVFDVVGSYDIAIIVGAAVLFIAAGCSFVIKAPYAKSA
ncbi:MAG: MFS transporter, partial [Dehalococcoidia bacterium]|nr:MFS transporter [Dehalococcoidia bacterium]